MSALKVKFAERFMNRQFGGIGKNPYKSLVELITNGDDSYSRLVDRGERDPDTLRQILVVWDKREREFHVVDHAEGMTDKVMVDKFGEYGKDSSGSSEGASVRGLFGQGISDVLFFHEKGHVESIVDRHLYRCLFINKDGEPTVDPKRTRATVNSKLRHSLRIPEGNGTVVSFRLARKPQKRFIERLERMRALRLINSDPTKLVRYIEVEKDGSEKSHDLHYEFPEGELLASEEVSWVYGDFPAITAHIELRRSDTPLDTLDDEESGLLVYDEKDAVYDFTLFGLNDPSLRLFGTVRLVGARDIIIATMNQQEPEEILSDDRSGFVQHHPFYGALQKAIKPVIEQYIATPEPETQEDRLTDKQRQNQKKALDIFNELYTNIIEDVTPVTNPQEDSTPPEDGMEFDRRSITATEGKTYGLGLNINAEMIPVGSVVSMRCDSDSIVVKPESFEVTEEMTSDGLARRFLSICGSVAGESGLVVAACDEFWATAVVTITNEAAIYPETMSFDPSTTTVRPNGSGKGFLFVNTSVIPLGSKLRFDVMDATTDIALEIDGHELATEDIAYDDVARLQLNFIAGEEGHAEVHAAGGDHQAALLLRVVERKPNEPEEPQDKFADWRFGDIARFQCYYDSDKTSKTYGVLVVSRSHALNRLYFGSEPTKQSVGMSITASAYLADLLLDAALDFMLSEKWRQESASGGSLTAMRDPHLYITRYLAAEKERIGPDFHRLFIDEDLMQQHEERLREASAIAAE